MIQKFLLFLLCLALAWGFWASDTFKEISAGVAIFLFGMICMERGFKAFSGGLLERALQFSTDRHWKSLLFGAVSTTLMQSSSLISVMSISFLSAGLITLAQGIGIIFGANLGTTTGAWIIAGFGLKVSLAAYALPLLVFGVLLQFQRSRSVQGMGQILLGFGFLFLGIDYMKNGFSGFSETLDLTQWSVSGWQGLLLYTAFGIIATVIMQSSHATLVIIITALGAGQVSYDNALALAIGSNVGTTITAILGAISAPMAGRRLAAAHLVFNLVTGVLALFLMDYLVAVVTWSSMLLGISADNFTLQLAVFHTLFNLMGVLIFFPLIDLLARLFERLLRGRGGAERVRPLYLSRSATEVPELAVLSLTRETQHLFKQAFGLMAEGINLSPDSILSEIDFDALLDRPVEVTELDFDAEYLRCIKPLHAANLAFYSRAVERTGEVPGRKLHALWQSNRDILAAVKATKHLRKNLLVHADVRHPALMREYNRLRFRVANLLRDLAPLREELVDPVMLLSLDALRLEQSDAEQFAYQRVDTLVRSHELTPEVAASLMNDAAYVSEIERHLLSMAESWLTAVDIDDSGALRLEEPELSRLGEVREENHD